jgi:hypothetical protein
MLSTSPTGQAAHQPRLSYLHGLGRQAYRLGTTAAGSIAHARKHTELVGVAERLAVMAGWADESRLAMEVA